MTKISKEDIQYLATLSSLSLSDEEMESLRTDIEKIINYVDKLGELDVEGVEPTYQVTDLVNVMRADETLNETELTREQLLNLSTDIQDNQVKVPKVL